MVHNGIEYGDMQLICEAYSILRHSLGKTPEEISKIMTEWNQGDLDSFLIEISADVLQQKDPVTGKPFVDVVLDSAGQKGTGKWTSVNALDLGIPAASVAEAVFARLISSQKDERVRASKKLHGSKGLGASLPITIEAVRDALYCSKLCCYAQGFELYAQASHDYKWNLDLAAIAQIFRGGCIIRARFLQKITEAFQRDAKLDNLLVDPYFISQVEKAQDNWRRVVARAALDGTPVPVFSSALSYFDSYRSEVLPANLLQAQRDYFGAHMYERIDQPRGEFFHIDWPDPKRPQLKSSELGMSR
jgi:6-phosphogluconate dehydrogenase